MLQKFRNITCILMGHSWGKWVSSIWEKEGVEDEGFIASRHCKHCSQNEYFYEGWMRISEEEAFQYDTGQNG